MFIIKLTGGLGNQMFQYALGRSLSIKNNQPMKLDTRNYFLNSLDTKTDTRIYGLKHFAINAPIASREEISRILSAAPRNKLLTLFDRIKAASLVYPYYMGYVIKEPDGNLWKFDERLLDHLFTHDVYIKGYWQTERYFSSESKTIKKEFSVITPPSEYNRLTLNRIKSCNATSLHIRRGDNTNPENPSGTLPMTYYEQATTIIKLKFPNTHFFVFSDDINWAKKNLSIGFNVTYIENEASLDYEDMRLMMNCNNHVIANSTFSWWGAWLAYQNNNLVVAPKRYQQRGPRANPDFYPSTWILI